MKQKKKVVPAGKAAQTSSKCKETVQKPPQHQYREQIGPRPEPRRLTQVEIRILNDQARADFGGGGQFVD